MSASTTLALNNGISAENSPHRSSRTYYYESQNGRNYDINNMPTQYYQYNTPNREADEHAKPLVIASSSSSLTSSTPFYSSVAISDSCSALLEKIIQTTSTNNADAIYSTTSPAVILHKKSNSYGGDSGAGVGDTMILPKLKSTILKQNSVNGRIATTLTNDSESNFITSGNGIQSSCYPISTSAVTGTAAATNDPNNIDIDVVDEHAPFLATSSSSSSSSNTKRRNSRSSHRSSRTSVCYRLYTFINNKWYLNYLVPLSVLCALMFVAYLMRDYATHLLYWIETQNPWIIFAVFQLLFIVVSFPIVVGYFVLMITSGYLFGCFKGVLTVVLGANVGIAIAHLTIRGLRHRIPIHRLIKNETGRAILRVISGPKAFKVVLFTRLTPIPFGIQNAIFGVSSINPRIYHSATLIGLLPAQIINVYLGSTLRSMHEVLNNHGSTAITSYISFGVEVICGIALMFWVVQKARKELSETLLSDISDDDDRLLNNIDV